jgi:hypothetical protein
MATRGDEPEIELLVLPGAELVVSLGGSERGLPILHIIGNRQGMLSLANVLLWLLANGFRREFLSVSALPFVRWVGPIALSIRVTDEQDTGDYGLLHRLDRGSQYEWELPEDDLRRLGLAVHHLGCVPEHGYDLFPNDQRGDAWVRLELDSNRRP